MNSQHGHLTSQQEARVKEESITSVVTHANTVFQLPQDAEGPTGTVQLGQTAGHCQFTTISWEVR